MYGTNTILFSLGWHVTFIVRHREAGCGLKKSAGCHFPTPCQSSHMYLKGLREFYRWC